MASLTTSLWHPIRHAVIAAIVLICHAALAGLITFAIWALERFIYLLWGSQDHRLFDILPLRYVFDGMEGAVFAIFIWYGLRDAVEIFGNGRHRLARPDTSLSPE